MRAPSRIRGGNRLREIKISYPPFSSRRDSVQYENRRFPSPSTPIGVYIRLGRWRLISRSLWDSRLLTINFIIVRSDAFCRIKTN
jgi:hypothetical protein